MVVGHYQAVAACCHAVYETFRAYHASLGLDMPAWGDATEEVKEGAKEFCLGILCGKPDYELWGKSSYDHLTEDEKAKASVVQTLVLTLYSTLIKTGAGG